jgi:signal transduction histidine kinase
MHSAWRINFGKFWGLLAHSLAGRLLWLTCLFVLMGEVVIFVIAVGNRYHELLADRIRTAEVTVTPTAELGDTGIPEGVSRIMLERAGIYAVILKYADHISINLPKTPPRHFDRTIVFEADSPTENIRDGLNIGEGFRCLFSGGGRVLMLVSPTRINDAQKINVILDERPIRAELAGFCLNLMWFAIFVSLFAAALMSANVYMLLVHPMRRIIRSITAFRENPEDTSHYLERPEGYGEIRQAERELNAMQRELYGFLRQRERLAMLGTAMARIQHDLRNILASAQLTSDRLAASGDPAVRRLTPNLVAAIDRAIELATNTLKFGHAEARPPERTRFPLAKLADEAAQTVLATIAAEKIPAFQNHIADRFDILADREQMFRILLNLIGNAAAALNGREGGAVTLDARQAGAWTEIDIADNGPGIPPPVQAKLFQPFALAAANGGSGLGLSIVRELTQGHGGDVTLVSTGQNGTIFRVTLPAGEAPS